MTPSLPFTLILAATLLANTACSNVGFSKTSSKPSLSVDSNNGSPTIPTNGTNEDSGTTVAIELPKIQFINPPCPRNSICELEFRLNKSFPSALDFSWSTNDNLYTTPNSPPYAQPGVHYIATHGYLAFAPGEISKKFYIQNINQNTYEVIIPIIISNCRYNGRIESCQSLINP